MSFVEPIEFHCPSCGKRCGNPRAALEDERGSFRSIVNYSEPRPCSDCNQRPTLVGIQAPAHLPADRCRCHIWPRHRLMADGHRPFCQAREPDDASVVDDPDARRR